jgi:hypothetical protein
VVTEERAASFLIALGRALSSARLYAREHPARESAVERVWAAARELLDAEAVVTLTFVEGDVALGDRRIPQLTDWSWASDFSRSGVERIELRRGMDREETARFLRSLAARMEGETPAGEVHEQVHVRYGPLAGDGEGSTLDVPELRAALEDELAAVESLMTEARTERRITPAVAEGVARSVAEAVRQAANLLHVLVPLEELEQYQVVHSLNVSALSVGFAEHQGYRGAEAQLVGKSALLHDVGKTLVPDEILMKPGELTPEEWGEVREHPAAGSRILLASDDDLTLPAIVAYEHHMYLDGTGYPERKYPRDPHPVTQLVQICDVYDALRSPRPFRPAWSHDKILVQLRQNAGLRYHPAVVGSFERMLEAWGEGDGAVLAGAAGEGSS